AVTGVIAAAGIGPARIALLGAGAEHHHVGAALRPARAFERDVERKQNLVEGSHNFALMSRTRCSAKPLRSGAPQNRDRFACRISTIPGLQRTIRWRSCCAAPGTRQLKTALPARDRARDLPGDVGLGPAEAARIGRHDLHADVAGLRSPAHGDAETAVGPAR